MARYDAVLFDLYGTLVDIRTDESAGAAWDALRGALVEAGCGWYRDRDDDQLRSAFESAAAPVRRRAAELHGRWAEPDLLPAYETLLTQDAFAPFERFEPFASSAPVPSADVADRAAAAAWAFRRGSTSLLRLYPGVPQLLGDLHRAGLRVVLVSNAQACYTRPELDLLGVADAFDHVLISSEEGVRKPSPEIFLRALDREGLQPDRAVMVGNDERSDILGARSAGIDGIYLRTEISPSDDPDVSQHAVQSFAGADYAGILRFLGVR
ncbi:haloacid dehalogenase-like hydrolase [Bifidobacterium hapali]|uniref:Haloacid dehalogenase-like hydrolase n=1 Tax=Bifidobacterium hapali TaxID=1630172 RepID=A0A261FX88_9BIFI|nr:HAD family hydrolase [Bifidobacterium hapali]OZG63728.1 haloacid dehalogenase-like hydrolase [Bifidobacterium hapali]